MLKHFYIPTGPKPELFNLQAVLVWGFFQCILVRHNGVISLEVALEFTDL